VVPKEGTTCTDMRSADDYHGLDEKYRK